MQKDREIKTLKFDLNLFDLHITKGCEELRLRYKKSKGEKWSKEIVIPRENLLKMECRSNRNVVVEFIE